MDNLVKVLSASNTTIIVQARMGSERLPGKVMREINGVPMIGIQLKRIRESGYKVVVATSNKKENDKLSEYVSSLGIDVYRGSEENVLERYYETAKKFNSEFIVRVTGDNPLIDGKFIRQTMHSISEFPDRFYISTGRSKTFPIGLSFEAFPFSLLEEAYFNAKSKAEKEHVTPYMHQNLPGNIEINVVKNSEDKSNIRLTVDTEDDFELIKILIEKFNCHKKTLPEIIEIVDKNPRLLEINKNIIQRKWNEK